MMMKTMKMTMKKNIDQVCSICGANSDLTEHHLIPKSIQNRKKIKNTNKEEVTGKTIPLCFTCHSALHNMFTEKELSENLYSLELIQQNTQFNKFIKWKIKHKDDTYFPSKMSIRKRR